jgi:hypothetical protein
LTKGAWIGNRASLANLSFVQERFPNVLGQPTQININGDANPVEFLYELLTNDDWGWGKPASKFTLSTFQAAATTIFNEGLGMSILWDSDTATIEEMVRTIENLVDGVLVRNLTTGKIELSSRARITMRTPSRL